MASVLCVTWPRPVSLAQARRVVAAGGTEVPWFWLHAPGRKRITAAVCLSPDRDLARRVAAGAAGAGDDVRVEPLEWEPRGTAVLAKIGEDVGNLEPEEEDEGEREPEKPFPELVAAWEPCSDPRTVRGACLVRLNEHMQQDVRTGHVFAYDPNSGQWTSAQLRRADGAAMCGSQGGLLGTFCVEHSGHDRLPRPTRHRGVFARSAYWTEVASFRVGSSDGEG